MRFPLSLLTAASAALLLASAAAAQVAAPPDTGGAITISAPGDTAWHLEADRLSGSNEAEEALELEGVRLRRGALTVTGRLGRYYRNTRIATLAGDVRIVDSTTTITGDEGEYHRDERVAIVRGHVRIVDSNVIMTGEEARYEQDAERLILSGNAEADEKGRTIRARRLIYLRNEGVLFAEDDVSAADDSSHTVVTGQRMRYDRQTAMSVLTGAPILRLIEEDSTRTQVAGDTLRFDTTNRVAIAEGNVRIVRSEVEARSARGVFYQREDRALLTGAPHAWDRDGYIEGDTLGIFMEKGVLRELRVLGHARVRYRPSDPAKHGERNYASGQTISLYFVEGIADRLRVDGTAHAEYFPSDEDRASGSGMNVSDADHILLFMKNGRADQAFLDGSAKGIYRFDEEAERARRKKELESAPPPSPGQPAPGRLGAADSLRLNLKMTGARFHDPVPPPLPPVASMPAGTGTVAFAAPVDTTQAESAAVAPPVQFAVADSAEAKSFKEQVEYQSQKIEIRVPENFIVLQQDATLRYRGMQLKADRVELDASEEFLTATGKPVLQDEKQKLVGDRMTYSLVLQKGTVYSGETQFESGFYWGEKIRRVDPRTLQVAGGTYTTCDLTKDPHYHFTSKKMRIILNDKVVAEPVVFYLRNIPVLALPFYISSIDKNRHSGFLVPDLEFGISRSGGRFVRNMGYYWAMSDYTDLTTSADYYEEGPPRWILNMDGRYRLRYLLSGNFSTSFSREKSTERSPGVKTPARKRWDFSGSHQQTLGERFSLTARGDFTSDKTYRSDKGLNITPIDNRINSQLRSNVAIRKDWSWGSFSGAVDRTQDLQLGQVTNFTAPTATFSLAQRTIGRKPDLYGQGGFLPALSSIYYSFSSRFANSYQAPTGQKKKTFRQAGQVSSGISDNRRYMGWLSLSPNFNYTASVFDRDLTGKKPAFAGIWNAGATASTTIYGTMQRKIGPLIGLRHVLRPRLSYSYQPDFRNLSFVDTAGRRVSRFETIGTVGAGAVSKGSSVSINIDNTFEAKVQDGKEVRKISNLAQLGLNANYNFLAKQQGVKHALSNIGANLQLSPHRTLSIYSSTVYDPYKKDISSLNVRTSFSLTGKLWGAVEGGSGGAGGAPEPATEQTNPTPQPALGTTETVPQNRQWVLNIRHSYGRGASAKDFTSAIDFGLSFPLTRNWYVRYANYYDLKAHNLTSQSWSIYRDLHCWEASFDRRLSAGRAEYYFRISIKQIPEIKYERRGLQ